MLKKVVKISCGILLIPFCTGFTWQLIANVFCIRYKPDLPYYFLAGALSYLTFHFLFKKPILAYVFGHELTHVFFAMLFGGSVTSFRASQRGGQVTLTRSNFMITLAPYFFPLYTCLAIALYLLAGATEARTASGVLIFFTGATFSFHLFLTVIFLQADQKDIREQGAIFSYTLIYLFNVLFAGLLLHLLLSQKNGFLDFLGNGIIRSMGMVALVFNNLSGFPHQ